MPAVFSKREQVILYLTICVVIFGLAFNFVIAPLLSASANLNKEITVARAKMNRYAFLLKQKDAIQKISSQFSAAVKTPGQEGNTLVTVLSELEGLAQEAGISIVDIAPQPPRGYSGILIDLKTEGPIEGYMKFFYSTEKSLSLLRIKKFQLNAKPNSQLLEGSFSVSHLPLT